MSQGEEKSHLEDLQAFLRRAERLPGRVGLKDALKRLIDSAHSPYTSVKLLVAKQLPGYIKDAGELEDDALNAVYDLCEDSEPNVRIQGYLAISGVSRAERKWIKRNADVLVQLLQSDDQEEVGVVKKSLTEHLDLDPAITLGVLCDQIIPLEDPMDDEEQAIRDRLRSLVLKYLSDDAKRRVQEHAKPGSSADEVLVTGLLKAMPQLNLQENTIITKDILLQLPSFGRLSLRGRQLVEELLSLTKILLNEDLPSGVTRSSLEKSKPYLELVSYVTIEKRAAHPRHLLGFIYSHLLPKLPGNRLSEDAKLLVFSSVGSSLAASENPVTSGEDSPNGEDFITLRRQLVNAAPALFSAFLEAKQTDAKTWSACKSLLKACNWRKTDFKWSVPSNLITSLLEVRKQAENEHKRGKLDKASYEEIQNLIRPFIPDASQKHEQPIASTSSTASSATNVTKGMSSSSNRPGPGKTNGNPPVIIKRNREERPIPLPPKPPASILDSNTNSLTDRRPERDRHAPRGWNSIPPLSSTGSSSGSPRKGGKQNGENGHGDTPSLLSRLGSNSESAVPAKRRAEETKRPNVIPDTGGKVEFSIKGAASRAATADRDGHASSRQSSLLDRMKQEGDNTDGGERRGRKRTKHHT
ncbi:hypothetical protein K474DRAFT_1665400 [Panus rudis PR-1116 ss-1]|nr:hypothetical protein K474DRAFT_1665400 [Panus rudis PR-1116 ss-1]